MKLTFNKVAEGTVALGLIFMFLCDAHIFHYLNEQIVLGAVFVQQSHQHCGGHVLWRSSPASEFITIYHVHHFQFAVHWGEHTI